MKKMFLFVLIHSTFFGFSQEKKNLVSKFDFYGMETSILLQKSPLIDIQQYQENVTDMYGFYQTFKDLSQSDLQQRFTPLSALKEKTKQSHFDTSIPLAIIHSQYETIKKEAFTNGTIIQDSEGYLLRTNTSEIIFEKQSITLASPLRIRKKGLQTSFKLASEDIYNTTNTSISKIRIDFNDTHGFQDITENKNISINYSEAGKKELIFEITFANGTIKTNRSVIDIRYSNADIQRVFNRTITTITASITPDLSVYGETTSYAGEGEYEIFMSTENGAVLDKPIFIIDGFDPKDARPIIGYTDDVTEVYVEGIYDLLNFDNNGTPSNLADMVREEGFDVIILNFPEYTRTSDTTLVDGGSDFIEKNAMVLVELINTINAQKIGTEPNVIIGPSMGGLISRYALNYMENQSLDYDTRLWVSFDSPHLGANIPIGFQHQFNFLAFGLDDFTFIGNQNVIALQDIVNGMLKSPAARQMLTDQFEEHLETGSAVDFDETKYLPQKHPFNPIFYTRMHALTNSGFPENVRKIAMINGSGINNRYQDVNGADIFPSRQILNTTFNVTTGTDITLSINFTPYANTQVNVSHVYLDFAWYIPAFDVTSNANSLAYSYSNGIDAASGGLYDLGKLTEELETTGVVGDFLAALQTDYFNFVPSVSAMALEITNNEIDWFQTPENLETTSPFDAWHMPENNETHITLTPENVDFAWNEIVLTTLNIATVFNTKNIRILNNPTTNNLVLLSNFPNSVEEINVLMYDVTGKKVVEYLEKNPATTIKIPLHLQTGIYFAHIITNNFFSVEKIIVK